MSNAYRRYDTYASTTRYRAMNHVFNTPGLSAIASASSAAAAMKQKVEAHLAQAEAKGA